MIGFEPERKEFVLSAVVGPGSHTNATYSFNIAGWNAHDSSLSMVFSRLIPLNFQDGEIYRAVQDLENILLALFVNDRLPRKIFHFFYPNDLEKETSVKLLFMLGQVQSGRNVDREVATESFSHCGFMYNRQLGHDWIPPISTITEWFNFFQENERLAGSIVLLQKSFWTINGLQGKYRYYDYLDLCEAMVLMIAGLESLFVRGDSENIASEFKQSGSTYYAEYVPEEYFHNFGQDAKKLSLERMAKVLGSLYGIRSAVAHGQARSVFAGKRSNRGRRWLEMIKWMNVAEKNPEDKTMFFSHVLLAMALFQKHVFAIISRLKDYSVEKLVDYGKASSGTRGTEEDVVQ